MLRHACGALPCADQGSRPLPCQSCLPQNNDGDKQQVQMACNLAQMQDLVSKLKDASKKLELMKEPNA